MNILQIHELNLTIRVVLRVLIPAAFNSIGKRNRAKSSINDQQYRIYKTRKKNRIKINNFKSFLSLFNLNLLDSVGFVSEQVVDEADEAAETAAAAFVVDDDDDDELVVVDVVLVVVVVVVDGDVRAGVLITEWDDEDDEDEDEEDDDDDDGKDTAAASAIARSSCSSSFSRLAHRPTFGWLDLAMTAPFFFDRHTTDGKRLELRKAAIFFSCSSFIHLGTMRYSG